MRGEKGGGGGGGSVEGDFSEGEADVLLCSLHPFLWLHSIVVQSRCEDRACAWRGGRREGASFRKEVTVTHIPGAYGFTLWRNFSVTPNRTETITFVCLL